jgi:hypothetical protein
MDGGADLASPFFLVESQVLTLEDKEDSRASD